MVFPMGVEAFPFLQRVEVTHRRRIGKAVYREALFEGMWLSILRSGIGPVRAVEAIKNLPVEPSLMIAAGSAGGLVPGLKFGDMIVSSQTVAGDVPAEPVSCPSQLVDAAVHACEKEGMTYRVVRLTTVSKPVFRRAERERLHRETGAHAVDMESHAMGMEARRQGIPFVSLRVISDDVDSPSLDDRRGFKNFWQRPLEVPKRLPAAMRWWRFVKDFKRAVNFLPPVLVRLLRESHRMRPLP